MKEETQMLWIIPGPGLEEKGLIDGEAIFYDFKIGERDHQALMQHFSDTYKLDTEFCSTHIDYGKFFTENGMILFINAGLISGKRAGVFFLPAQMSEKQINFLEQRRELFKEHFHENASFFEIAILPNGDLPYKTTSGFRDLQIESIIDGCRSNNGQELIFKEIARQKQNLIEGKQL